jgi:hypothetical protein
MKAGKRQVGQGPLGTGQMLIHFVGALAGLIGCVLRSCRKIENEDDDDDEDDGGRGRQKLVSRG